MDYILFYSVGIPIWPLLEYLIHGGLGHKYLRGKTAFSREHIRHHAEREWFAPSSHKAVAAVPVFAVTFCLFIPVFGMLNSACLTTGFATMYLFYELMHRRAHTHPPRGPYGRWLRKNHFYHHFANTRKNYGVTSPVLDLLFGSYVKSDVITVPERFAMRWLIDPDTKDVWQQFAQDYRLKKSTPA